MGGSIAAMSLISISALAFLVAAFTGLAAMTWRHRDWRFGVIAAPILVFVALDVGFGITGDSDVIRVIVACGGFFTFFVIYRIIRDRTELEISLRQSEQRYRSIFESAEVGLTQVRLSDGKLLDANNQAAHLIGYRDRDHMMAEFEPERHWVDIGVRENSIRDGLAGRVVRDKEIEVKRLDGVHIWERVSLSFFPEEDYMVAVAVDITESKKAEAELKENQSRLDAALESFSDGFVLFDADERFVLCNNAYRDAHPKIVELQLPGDKLEDITRKLAKVGFYGNDPSDAEEVVLERLRRFRSGQPYEYRMANGHWYEMRHYSTSTGGTALVRNDITAGKKANRA